MTQERNVRNSDPAKVYEAHEWLEKFYHHILLYSKGGEHAKEYLNNRGIHESTIKKFRIGFSLLKSDVTFQFLKNKGFNYSTLAENKVLRRLNNGKLSNMLRNRIVFPIRDYQNRTVALGGRSIDKDNKVKYINSEESIIFKKQDNLFGFPQAMEDIESLSYAIVLEGYFDVLKAYQNGVKNVVASLGTALTTNQALLLKNITDNIVIAYDGDGAGMDNSFRSASILDSIGCHVRIAHLEEEQDPDEYISAYGCDTFMSEIISKANNVKLSLVDYKKQNYDLTHATDRFDYAEEVLKGVFKGYKKGDEQVLKKLEEILDVSFSSIQQEIAKHTKEAYK